MFSSGALATTYMFCYQCFVGYVTSAGLQERVVAVLRRIVTSCTLNGSVWLCCTRFGW
jgi:hypothetical protein